MAVLVDTGRGTEAAASVRRADRPYWRRNLPLTVILYVVLGLGSAAFVYPFLWMIATSLRSLAGVGSAGASIWPSEFLWDNYTRAITSFPFWRYALNSVLTTLIPIVGTVFSCALAGFAFARLRVRFSGLVFAVVLATMLLPGEVTMVPQFMLFNNLGMIDTLYPLILPAFFGSPFYIFLFRQFFSRMPAELADAAVVDGCGWFKMFWLVYLPLARPAVVAVSILLFMGYWNNFLGPAIYINSDQWKTLPLALAGFQSVNGTDTPLLMATSVLITLPCLAIFFLAQKQITNGITFTGGK
ncbi:carbohydrate ABC transporter permease [Kribbella sp. NPDC051770]|uniref:carbohydrate ABC transporter permease n=1 Tax=Kribbella sp. NPDC051770 TaxID=3155413 RepID=UPI003416EE48